MKLTQAKVLTARTESETTNHGYMDTTTHRTYIEIDGLIPIDTSKPLYITQEVDGE